jgi:hypothetical protein
VVETGTKGPRIGVPGWKTRNKGGFPTRNRAQFCTGATFNTLNYDLASQFAAPPDLTVFVTPFTKLEIDSIVRSLPSDKAPGPNGINTDFGKHCWFIICSDFYKLCAYFFSVISFA